LKPLLEKGYDKDREDNFIRATPTPADEWYDQEKDEWVMLLEGSAGIRFEGDDDTLTLLPGDFIMIPAHLRHRVEWTDQKGRTLWLAVHF